MMRSEVHVQALQQLDYCQTSIVLAHMLFTRVSIQPAGQHTISVLLAYVHHAACMCMIRVDRQLTCHSIEKKQNEMQKNTSIQ
jgi:hypothetical protein